MSLSLSCFFLGDDPNWMFTVKVSSANHGENASQLKDVDAPDLEIWKVDFLPIGNLPSTNLLTDELQLRSGKLLSDVLPSGLDINRVVCCTYSGHKRVLYRLMI